MFVASRRSTAAAFVCRNCGTCIRSRRRRLATSAPVRSLSEEMDRVPEQARDRTGTSGPKGKGGPSPRKKEQFLGTGLANEWKKNTKVNKLVHEARKEHRLHQSVHRASFEKKGDTAKGKDDFRYLHKALREEGGMDDEGGNTISPVRIDVAKQANMLIRSASNEFAGSGLRPVVVNAMHRAYPRIGPNMTDTQTEMITLLKRNYSLVVRGLPGSGKSFAIALWLLGIDRAIKVVVERGNQIKKVPALTSLLLVPTPELGLQYAQWLESILGNFDTTGARKHDNNSSKPSNAQIFQVLYRGSEREEAEQEERLRNFPNPHIIISTPKRLLDLLDSGNYHECLDFQSVRKIVVDEADFLITHLKHGVNTQQIMELKHVKQKRSKETIDAPAAKILDYILDLQPYKNRSRGLPGTHQIQLVLVSATANSRLRAQALFQRRWLVRYSDKSEPVKLVSRLPENNMPVIGVKNANTRSTILQKSIPDNLIHHVVTFDRATGMMADAPIPTLTHQQIIDEAFNFEIKDVEKAAQRLRAMNDSRFEVMTNEEAGESVKDEIAQVALETADTYSQEQERLAAVYYRAGVGVEVISTLLEHDNYPEDVMVFVHPHLSKRHYIDELKENDFNVVLLTPENMKTVKNQRKSQKGQAREEKEGDGRRSRLDTTIWISDAVTCRGLDTKNIYHAYIIYPWTRPFQYVHMCGRIARSVLPSHVKTRKGHVTSVILADDIPAGTLDHVEGEVESPGVILRGVKSENKQWRDIALRMGKCMVQSTPYFKDGVSAPNTQRLFVGDEEGDPLPMSKSSLSFDDDGDEESLVRDKHKQKDAPGIDEPKKLDGPGYRFLDDLLAEEADSTPATAEADSPEQESEQASVEESGVTTLDDELSKIEKSNSGAASDEITESPTTEELREAFYSSNNDDAPDSNEDSIPFLEDGPHFAAEENATKDSISTDTPESMPEPTEENDEHAHLLNKPLELGEGVTKEDAEEFQKAQDEIFSSFLELQMLMDEVKKKREAEQKEEEGEGEGEGKKE